MEMQRSQLRPESSEPLVSGATTAHEPPPSRPAAGVGAVDLAGRILRKLVRWIQTTLYFCFLILIPCMLAFMILVVPPYWWRASSMRKARLEVVSRETHTLNAAAAGVVRLERPLYSGEFVQAGTVFGCIEAAELDRELARERLRVDTLSQRLLQLESRWRKTDTPERRFEVEREIREVSEQHFTATQKLQQLEEQCLQCCKLVSPVSGWIIAGVPQQFDVTANEPVLEVAPETSQLWLKVQAPSAALPDLSAQEGFPVQLTTSSGPLDCLAVRVSQPIQTGFVAKREDSELWVTFFARMDRQAVAAKPGDCGVIKTGLWQ